MYGNFASFRNTYGTFRITDYKKTYNSIDQATKQHGNREEKCDVMLPWQQNFRLSTIFSWPRRSIICIVERCTKVWTTVLVLRAIMHRRVKRHFHRCFCFSAIFEGPQFVEIQKFCYNGNVTSRLLRSIS